MQKMKNMKSMQEQPKQKAVYKLFLDGERWHYSYWNGEFFCSTAEQCSRAEGYKDVESWNVKHTDMYIGWLPHQVEIEPVDNPLEEKVIDLLRNKEYNKIIELMNIFKE